MPQVFLAFRINGHQYLPIFSLLKVHKIFDNKVITIHTNFSLGKFELKAQLQVCLWICVRILKSISLWHCLLQKAAMATNVDVQNKDVEQEVGRK